MLSHLFQIKTLNIEGYQLPIPCPPQSITSYRRSKGSVNSLLLAYILKNSFNEVSTALYSHQHPKLNFDAEPPSDSIPKDFEASTVTISDRSEQPAKITAINHAKNYMIKLDFIWKPLLRKFRQFVRKSLNIKNGDKN